jgi:3-oxoacyl-[acyl-carrier protein] reductase
MPNSLNMQTGARNGKTAIVTGATRGIGAAIARRLALDGFSVVLTFVQDGAAADAQVAVIRAAGGRATAVQADVSDADRFEQLFDEAEAAYGGSDVLVNNAGVMMLSTIVEATDDHFDQQVAVNLHGAFNGMREAGKRLRPGGRIISISSSIVGLYLPTFGIYAATKSAIEAMTRILAKELRGKSITVNAVAPGPVAIDTMLNGQSPEVVEQLNRLGLSKRLSEVEDIASVVSFLAGSQGGWINGLVLRADGGLV